MIDPVAVLESASTDDWSNPTAAARSVLEAIRTLLERDWGRGLHAVHELRSRRSDVPFLLAVTEPALDPNPLRVRTGLGTVERGLDATSWANELGLRCARRPSLGVVSLGDTTLAVLEEAASSGEPDLFAGSAAVARGLGYLRLAIIEAPPEQAATLLLPAAARFRNRVWTTAHAADIALRAEARGTPIVPVVHPLAVLSPLNRKVYRPAAILIDVEL